MVQTFSRLGPCTVRELADELGREPATLYYHVHALVDSGIVRETGKRKAGTRPESVYSLVAERILIDRSETSEPFLSALADLQRATLRTAERELVAALEARDPKGSDDSPTLLRIASRLKPQDAARAIKMLHELVEFLAESDDPEVGDTYSLTAAFTRLTK
jgi:predicted ArsR family transcriptional regulator